MKYLSIDLGATSGRFIVSNGVEFREIYRFDNFLEVDLTWNLNRLIKEVENGLIIAKDFGVKYISIDTWGVDFVDVDNKSGFSKSYRFTKNEEIFAGYSKILDQVALYKSTGILSDNINTLYRLDENTEEILFIRDYLHAHFTGVKITDPTILSTAQIFDFDNNKIDAQVSKIASNLVLPKIVTPGTLAHDVLPQFGIDAKMVVGAAHDTANCFYYYTDNNAIIVNIGTWAIIGINSENAIKTEMSFEQKFSNERAVSGYRILRNVEGLYTFDKKRKELYPSLNIVNVMELLESKSESAQAVELDNILDEVAHNIAHEVSKLENLIGEKNKDLIIMGGGSKNKPLLNKIKSLLPKNYIIIGDSEATVKGSVKLMKEYNESN